MKLEIFQKSMKNATLFSLLLAAGSLMSCDSNALLEPEVPGYFVIDGDTVRISL